MRIGYACLAIAVPGSKMKNCTLKNADAERLLSLIEHNLNSLETLIDYNICNNIRLFRISSDLIPFGSSLATGLKWEKIYLEKLSTIGQKILCSEMRVSMHPGQYTVLNSPDRLVAERAVEDLHYHATVLDSTGLGSEHKIILHDDCVHHDDVEILMNKMMSADGIILSSPVYLQQVSGKLKSFIDRTCKWYHRPVLYGKPVICVATTKGSGLKSTLSYLRSVAVQWGAMPAGSIGRTIRNINSPVVKKELLGFIILLQAPQSYRPPLNSLINFELQKALAKYLNGLDTCYWSEKGWDKKPYFFECSTNGFKCIISKIFGAVLQRIMSHSRIKSSKMV